MWPPRGARCLTRRSRACPLQQHPLRSTSVPLGPSRKWCRFSAFCRASTSCMSRPMSVSFLASALVMTSSRALHQNCEHFGVQRLHLVGLQRSVPRCSLRTRASCSWPSAPPSRWAACRKDSRPRIIAVPLESNSQFTASLVLESSSWPPTSCHPLVDRLLQIHVVGHLTPLLMERQQSALSKQYPGHWFVNPTTHVDSNRANNSCGFESPPFDCQE